jgi:hypothetical protein
MNMDVDDYAAIRQRVAAGGPEWRGWPETGGAVAPEACFRNLGNVNVDTA